MRQGDRLRLVRVLGMLGSAHDGERSAAALAAHRLVTGAGLTWSELLLPQGLRDAPRKDVGQRWADPFTDYVAAADSRLRQVRDENEALRREVRHLRQLLDGRHQRPRQRG
ncbi:hypothetical protein L2U69_08445 [Zavarzinia compransoris]|uniref:hypothetical protein n=1 Tax=Zavarzinia marina TaxID=2911065 RepID=UPI001F4159D2|nr:hypothetical protein [Zavarzinia marina]MCF4165669.1 hypothetical protein [Zavarzinia marina]